MPSSCALQRTQLENHGFHSRLHVVKSLALTPGHHLWVRRAVGLDGDDGPMDVFGFKGECEFSLPDSTPFPLLFLPEGRAMARVTDPLGVESIAVGRYTPRSR